jgi:hypothetical protein
MTERASLASITFTENGPVDVAQLNALHQLIGWDRHCRRTAADTAEARVPWWASPVSVATRTWLRCWM